MTYAAYALNPTDCPVTFELEAVNTAADVAVDPAIVAKYVTFDAPTETLTIHSYHDMP